MAHQNANLPAANDAEPRNYEFGGRVYTAYGDTLQPTTCMLGIGATQQFGQCSPGTSPCITHARGGSMGYRMSNQNRYNNIHDLGRPQGLTTKGVNAIISSGVPESKLEQRLAMQ